MHYPDSVQYLYALGNELKSVKLGLERIHTLLAALGNPQQRYRVVHVAGTNGKGSTCAMIASGLQAAGYRTGLYTSPHLIEPTERIRVNGEEISQPHFVDVFRRVHEVAEAMVAEGSLDMHPTYFETVTAMGFLAFADRDVDVAVVEVGLGGRLDATNVVQPELCVVTPIDYDHEAWLGKSIPSIASEKAGILKPGVPALFSLQRPEARKVLETTANRVGAEAYSVEEWRLGDLQQHADGCNFTVERHRPLRISCPLRGRFQEQNARVAAAALDLLGVSTRAIEAGIAGTRWSGRLDKLSTAPDIYVDGAHNPAGCAALAAYMREFRGAGSVWLVFGAMRDKAVSEMAAALFPVADRVIVTAPRQPRAVRPEVLAEEAGDTPVMIAPTLDNAMDLLSAAAPADQVYIAGSLFLAGEAVQWFRARRDSLPQAG